MTNEPQTPEMECPEIEQLAALLDARLGGKEREQVVEHLNQCEACYEIFAETLRFKQEETESGRLIEHPATRRRFTWAAASMAAAAVLALIVALPLWYLQRFAAPGDFAAYRLADRLVAGSEAAALMNHTYSGDGWSRTRGFGALLNERQRAFRLGVRTIDLEIALRTSDGERAERLLHELADMASDLPLPEMILVSYNDLVERLELGEAPESLVDRSTGAASLVDDAAASPYYALGQWAEAGLLAASSGDAEFFRQRAVRRFSRDLEAADLPEELHGPLSRISLRLEQRVDHDDLEPLIEAFAQLIELGGNV
ncbi:MAG: hypothetical protein WBQ27_20690 [Thermoanaerobaculia bacterium]